MGPWSVLEPFCIRNRNLNAFICNFKQFQNFRFFGNFHVWDPQKWARRNFYECRNFEKMLKTGLKHHKPHHNKFAANNSTSFWKKVKNVKKSQKVDFASKSHFLCKCCFCCFCCFFVAKMLFIKKSIFRPTFWLPIIFSYLL